MASAKQQANSYIVGTTLILVIGLPVYCQYVVADWTTSLSPLAQLFLTNTVVIAVVMGIILNLLLNVAFKGDQEEVEE